MGRENVPRHTNSAQHISPHVSYVFQIQFQLQELNTIGSGRMALSPDGSQLAVVMQGGIDKIDVSSRRQTLVANTHCGLECPLEFIHGGTVLLSSYGCGVAQLWTLSGDKLQAVMHSSRLTLVLIYLSQCLRASSFWQRFFR